MHACASTGHACPHNQRTPRLRHAQCACALAADEGRVRAALRAELHCSAAAPALVAVGVAWVVAGAGVGDGDLDGLGGVVAAAAARERVAVAVLDILVDAAHCESEGRPGHPRGRVSRTTGLRAHVACGERCCGCARHHAWQPRALMPRMHACGLHGWAPGLCACSGNAPRRLPHPPS